MFGEQHLGATLNSSSRFVMPFGWPQRGKNTHSTMDLKGKRPPMKRNRCVFFRWTFAWNWNWNRDWNTLLKVKIHIFIFVSRDRRPKVFLHLVSFFWGGVCPICAKQYGIEWLIVGSHSVWFYFFLFIFFLSSFMQKSHVRSRTVGLVNIATRPLDRALNRK